jgi:SET domain-containing protein
MCNCYNCELIMDDLIELIDNSSEYPDKDLKSQLEPYVYYKVKQYKKLNKPFEISTCPDTSKYCEIFDTEFIGQGVRAIDYIPKNTVIGCYLGCIKLQRTDKVDWKYSFAFALNPYVIDGSDKKSMMSIVNHSRDPNVDIDYQYHIVDGKKQCHIVFITKKHIFTGEELYIDYGDDYWKWASKNGMIELGRMVLERPNKKQKKITDYF